MKLFLLLAAIILPGLAQAGKTISSEPGSINRLTSQHPVAGRKLEFVFSVIKTADDSNNWAPMAFVAATDKTRNSEFQVFIFRKKDGGSLVLGHKYVEGGKVVFTRPLFHGVPFSDPIKILITVSSDGTLVVEQPDVGGRHEYKTNLREVYSSIAVSGATADFSVSYP